MPQLPIKAAVDVTGGSNRSVYRRASVPLEILIHLGGTPPFRVQPDENSQGTNLQGTGRKNPHLPQTGIIDCRHIGRPYRPPRGEQASETLFRRNAERISPATGLTSRLSDGRVHRRSRQIEIAFASSVPVYELSLIVFSHSFYSATKGAARACYNRNVDGSDQAGRPQIEPERKELSSQLDGGVPTFCAGIRRVYCFCIGAAPIDCVGGSAAALGLK